MEQELIRELVGVIRQEEDLLRQFLELLEQQKKLLVANKAEEFEASVREQEQLVGRIRSLEADRVARVHQIAEGLDLREDEITITRLVELSLGQVSDELSEAKRSMTALVERIRRANKVNAYLVKRSLNIAQRSIDILIDESLRDVIYEQDGKVRGQERRALMVNKTL